MGRLKNSDTPIGKQLSSRPSDVKNFVPEYFNNARVGIGGSWEYLVKWFGHSNNTWEPQGNIEHCRRLLHSFWEEIGLDDRDYLPGSVCTPSASWINKEKAWFAKHCNDPKLEESEGKAPATEHDRLYSQVNNLHVKPATIKKSPRRTSSTVAEAQKESSSAKRKRVKVDPSLSPTSDSDSNRPLALVLEHRMKNQPKSDAVIVTPIKTIKKKKKKRKIIPDIASSSEDDHDSKSISLANIRNNSCDLLQGVEEDMVSSDTSDLPLALSAYSDSPRTRLKLVGDFPSGPLPTRPEEQETRRKAADNRREDWDRIKTVRKKEVVIQERQRLAEVDHTWQAEQKYEIGNAARDEATGGVSPSRESLRGKRGVVAVGSVGNVDSIGEYHHASIDAERKASRVQTIKDVLDCHGQIQARLTCRMNGIWSVCSTDNSDTFTVNFDDPLFRDVIKRPWDHPEWSTPSRINILLELLYWETRLSAAHEFEYELFRCIHYIVRKYEMLPPSLYLRDLVKEGNDQIWGGGYADIYKGRTANGEPTCLKVLRVFTTQEARKQLFKEFSQEVLIWSQLDHPNVLSFLGINMDLFPGRYCLVSPWCSHGSVMNYLSMYPEADKMGIIMDILTGLEYLHTRNPPVVHGDLKGANILVSDHQRCRLADFGLAGMNTIQTLSSASGNPRGSTRWMAPELFDYTTTSRPSTYTDIYALGCTILEIITGAPPFSDIRHDAAVTFQVMTGFRPSRPAKGFSDRLWRVVERCWVDCADRPTIQAFIDDVKTIAESVERTL